MQFVGGADLQFGKGDRYSAVILVIHGIEGITPANAAQDRRKDLLFRGITEVNVLIPVVRNLGSNHSNPVHSVRGEQGIVNLSTQRVTGVVAEADRINEIACQIQTLPCVRAGKQVHRGLVGFAIRVERIGQ